MGRAFQPESDMGTTLSTAVREPSTGRVAPLEIPPNVEHADLWRRYAAGDGSARAALLEKHLGLVHYIARQLAAGLADEVQFEDLLGAGTLGLISAIEHFEPARGLRFSTYAATRIRGNILDDLRAQDRVPRSVRRRARELGEARAALAAQLGRAPTVPETARQLGITTETLHEWMDTLEGTKVVSLDHQAAPDADESGVAIIERIAPATHPDLDEHLTDEREVMLLREAIVRLPDRERQVLSLLYFEELTLAEASRTIGLTDSRISQIRDKALARLRVQLAPMRRLVA